MAMLVMLYQFKNIFKRSYRKLLWLITLLTFSLVFVSFIQLHVSTKKIHSELVVNLQQNTGLNYHYTN
jgi:hypothetical protein